MEADVDDEGFTKYYKSKAKRKLEARRQLSNHASIHGDNSYVTNMRAEHFLDTTNNTNEQSNMSQDSISCENVSKKRRSNENQIELMFVLIRSADKNDELALTRIDPWAVGSELESIIGDVKVAKTTRAGNILVGVETPEQYEALVKLERFLEYNVIVEPAELVGTVRGVMADRRLIDKSEDYILDKLRSQGVVKVRRIETTNSSNEKQPTPLLKLTIKAKTLPKSIKLGHEICHLKPYQIRPQQCKKCFRFGHFADKCRREKQVCNNCGIEGICTGECELPTKCCLCDGNHKADDQTCPRWEKQIEIAEIRTKHQVGYKRAFSIYASKHSTKPMSAVGASWGPSLIASDSERVTLNTTQQMTRSYKQAFLKNKTDDLRNSTSFESSDDDPMPYQLLVELRSC